MKWQELGQTSGKGTLALPSEWKELHVIVYASQYSSFVLSILSSDIIAASETKYNFGRYKDATSYVAGGVVIRNNIISIGEFIADGTDRVASGHANIKVSYR